VHQVVLSGYSDRVRGHSGGRGVDGDLALGVQPVADPPQPDLADTEDA
jgi:hypothetical protein